MATRYDLVIVGLGSAGLVAAEFAAGLGLRVCAVERDRVGGDCLWTGCVPSKALLAAGRAAHAVRTAPDFGVDAGEPRIDGPRVLARIRAVQGRIAGSDDDPDRYRAMGVDVRVGEPAVLVDPHRVRVGTALLDTKHVLLCTGSHPAVPDIPGLADAPFLTSETVWDLPDLPRSLLALGGGPLAVELAQAFGRLGVEVTILERGPRLLSRDDFELADRLTGVLREEGVRVEPGVAADRVTQDARGVTVHAGDRAWTAERLLVATGRRPAVEGLGLESVGVRMGERGVEVDDRSRTSIRSIRAVGDLAGRHHLTHAAAQEAAMAVRDIAFPGRGRADRLVPWVTYTDPELAHAGKTAAEAGPDAERWVLPLDHSDRARADGAEAGALVAVTVKGRLVGAHLLAPAAGELIGELAQAIQDGRRLRDLTGLVRPYPTVATGVSQLAARAAWADAGRYKWLVRA